MAVAEPEEPRWLLLLLPLLLLLFPSSSTRVLFPILPLVALSAHRLSLCVIV
jgi:hypothetical protein